MLRFSAHCFVNLKCYYIPNKKRFLLCFRLTINHKTECVYEFLLYVISFLKWYSHCVRLNKNPSHIFQVKRIKTRIAAILKCHFCHLATKHFESYLENEKYDIKSRTLNNKQNHVLILRSICFCSQFHSFSVLLSSMRDFWCLSFLLD